jgi:hypothetical protein
MILRIIVLVVITPFVPLAIVLLVAALALQMVVPSLLWLALTPALAIGEARREWTKWRAR